LGTKHYTNKNPPHEMQATAITIATIGKNSQSGVRFFCTLMPYTTKKT